MSDDPLAPPERVVLDYELADVVVADTPTRLKALGHPLRSLLVDLVLERAMTVTELAELVGKPRGSVAHHVDVLVEAGMLQVVRTRRVRALEERYYGRTGRTIVFPEHAHTSHDLPFAADVRREMVFDGPADTPGGFTYRRARIPAERAAEFTERVMALALEFTQLPRAGDQEFGFYVGVFPTNRLPGRGGPTDDAAAERPAKTATTSRTARTSRTAKATRTTEQQQDTSVRTTRTRKEPT